MTANAPSPELDRGLGAGEIWIWRRGAIEVHLLAGERYEPAARSRLFPELDLAVLAGHLERGSQSEAVLEFRARLRVPK